MAMFPTAVETQRGDLGEPGEDQQPMTLGEHLQSAFAIMSQDRVLDPGEMREFMAFVQGVKMLGQQRGTQGKTLSGAPTGAGPEPFAPGAPEDFGTTPGTQPLPGYEG